MPFNGSVINNNTTPIDQLHSPDSRSPSINSLNSVTNTFTYLDTFILNVGGTTFKLSEKALLHDSPNYFTDFFTDPMNMNSVLNIDRDPEIFKDIVSGKNIYIIYINIY